MISTDTSTATGVLTGPTQTIALGFYFIANTDLVVTRTRAGVITTLTLDSDYSVIGAGNESGGSITVTGQAAGDVITIVRTVPLTQLVDLVPLTKLSETSLEQALDKLTMIGQQLKRSQDASGGLPTRISSTALGVDSEGNWTQRDAAASFTFLKTFGGLFGNDSGTIAEGNDPRIVSGGNALQPNGNGSQLTGITPSQIGAATAAQGATADAAASGLSSHVGNTSNPHGTTAAQTGAVPTSRTVNGHALTADVTVTKADVGLGNVDNTADANKPVSTAAATALSAKANTADLGTAAFTASTAYATAAQGATADAAAAGLASHVGNTANPHGTTAAQTGAVPTSRTVNGHALTTDVTVTKSDVGLGNVDNTSDANKPVSTAQATAIAAQTFSAVALTNPYAASTPLTPRYVGDVAVNLTSLEMWASNAVTAATTSWEIIAQGPFGGTLITDAHSITMNGFYSAVSTAANLPTSDESYYIQALCSNLSTSSAVLVATGLTSGKMWMKRKVSSVWGSWVGGVTNTELSYSVGVTSGLQSQLNAKAPLASPALTGAPTAPTPEAHANDTRVATTQFLSSALSETVWPNLVDNSGRFFTPASKTTIDITKQIQTFPGTLSITASTATLTDSANSINPTTFPVGRLVGIRAANNPVNRIQAIVSAVTSSSIKLTGDDVSSLVDEAAGATITLASYPAITNPEQFNAYYCTRKSVGVMWYGNGWGNIYNGDEPSEPVRSLITKLGAYQLAGIPFHVVQATKSGAYGQMFYNGAGQCGVNGWATVSWLMRVRSASGSVTLGNGSYPFNLAVDSPQVYTPISNPCYTIQDNEWHYYRVAFTSSMGLNDTCCFVYGAANAIIEYALPWVTPGRMPPQGNHTSVIF